MDFLIMGKYQLITVPSCNINIFQGRKIGSVHADQFPTSAVTAIINSNLWCIYGSTPWEAEHQSRREFAKQINVSEVFMVNIDRDRIFIMSLQS